MLELTTPDIRPDQRLAAEFRPGKLESWLARLPAMDRESCLQQLYRALTVQNRVALAPDVRIRLMELYIEPFQNIYALHHSDLRTISRVPTHRHYRARQQEMLGMLNALATGYKIAVLDLVAQRTGYGRDANLTLAVQRAMHYLGQVLVTVYELYMRPPAGTWREIHHLYRCAEEEGRLGEEVRPVKGRPDPEDTLKTYVSILLVGASSPLSLLSGEVRRLYELTPHWHSGARITGNVALPASPGYFRISLNADAPPVPASKSPRTMDSDTRVFRTLGVARAMHESMMDINDAESLKAVQRVLGPGVAAMDAELFRRVGRVLGEVDIKRSSSRARSARPLEFCSGFNSVYSACGGGRPVDPFAAGDGAPARPEGQPDEQFIDLSEPMLGVPIEDSTAPGAQGRRAPSHQDLSLSATCVNEGAGGMCLTLRRSEAVQTKVGDVVACRFPGVSRWQLGAVRWLRVTSKELRLGIQFLGPVAIPVVASAGGAPGSQDPGPPPGNTLVNAIWLPGKPALKQPNSLLLPRAAESYPKELEITEPAGKAPAKLRLLGRIERTGDYERFLVARSGGIDRA